MGIGKRSLVNYILNHNIYVPRMKYATDVGKWSYVTTIAGILIYYGLAGIFFWNICRRTNKKKKDFMIREFIVLLVAISVWTDYFVQCVFCIILCTVILPR